MSAENFNPQDYFDCSLVEGLDRLARKAGIIDAGVDMRKNNCRDIPSEEWPWVFIDYRRFDLKRRAAEDNPGNSLTQGLRERPFLDEAECIRWEEQNKEADARTTARRAFEDAIRLLIEALQAGQIVVRGFRKNQGKGQVAAELVDSARWSVGWLINRNDDTAIVEFFSDITREDAEVILSHPHLAAPVASHEAAKPPREAMIEDSAINHASQEHRGPGNRPVDDADALIRLIEILNMGGHSLLGACTILRAEAVKGKMKMKIASEKALAKRLGSKLKRTHQIIEDANGAIAKVVTKPIKQEI